MDAAKLVACCPANVSSWCHDVNQVGARSCQCHSLNELIRRLGRVGLEACIIAPGLMILQILGDRTAIPSAAVPQSQKRSKTHHTTESRGHQLQRK